MHRVGRKILRAGAAAFLFVLGESCGNDLVCAQGATASVPTRYEVIFEHNVAARTRDGVTLRADIYRPQADGKFPVLLERTPYDKTGEREFGMRAAARG